MRRGVAYLRADLVAALARLNVHDLAHGRSPLAPATRALDACAGVCRLLKVWQGMRSDTIVDEVVSNDLHFYLAGMSWRARIE